MGEIYYDNPSSSSATVKASHIGALFVYTHPDTTEEFYVKEYISDTLDFDPERTNTEVRKYKVIGKAPVVTVIFEDKEETEPEIIPMPYKVGEPLKFTSDKVKSFTHVLLYTDEARSELYDDELTVTEDLTLYAAIQEFADLPDDWDDFPPNTLQYVLAAALAVVAILILIIVLRRREV